MNEENKRTFTIAACITSYSLIFKSIDGLTTESFVVSALIRVFLIALLVVIAYIFVYSVENKAVDEEEGEEGDDVDEY